jgi:hypothetical protein|tara:strand:- start:1018 stop:1284 length:267 start_codon:yes stop_codon:yes gene_type:complete
MAGSYYFVKNNPNIKEANFFLPERPSFGQFVAHKAITTPIVAQNVEAGQMTIMNSVITIVVLHNWYLYTTTPECPPNFYHDTGERVPC